MPRRPAGNSGGGKPPEQPPQDPPTATAGDGEEPQDPIQVLLGNMKRYLDEQAEAMEARQNAKIDEMRTLVETSLKGYREIDPEKLTKDAADAVYARVMATAEKDVSEPADTHQHRENGIVNVNVGRSPAEQNARERIDLGNLSLGKLGGALEQLANSDTSTPIGRLVDRAASKIFGAGPTDMSLESFDPGKLTPAHMMKIATDPRSAETFEWAAAKITPPGVEQTLERVLYQHAGPEIFKAYETGAREERQRQSALKSGGEIDLPAFDPTVAIASIKRSYESSRKAGEASNGSDATNSSSENGSQKSQKSKPARFSGWDFPVMSGNA